MSSPFFTNEDDLFLAALTAVSGLGPKRLRRLFSHTSSWKSAFLAPSSLWKAVKIPVTVINDWQLRQKRFDHNQLADYLLRTETCLLTPSHPDYPLGLEDLAEDSPLLLYARGHIRVNESIVAVSGPRYPSASGLAVIEDFIPGLCQADIAIASGLAEGIDTAAHRCALSTNGRTIAILGSGFNHIYPPTNKRLAEQIIEERGLLLSEYHPSALPSKYGFIARNRLIAALSRSVFIPEANLKSGTMHTARLAKALGRRLVIPASTCLSASGNRLLEEGAITVADANDIIKLT